MNLVVLPGDGIGPEVTTSALEVLQLAASRYKVPLAIVEDVVGGASIDAYGTALRPETLDRCRRADAILFGAVGGPRWDDANPDPKVRPGTAILGLRRSLGLFANLRPVRVERALRAASSLKPDLLDGVDLMVVRELTGGLYFSKPKRRYESARGKAAVDTMRYTAAEVERVSTRAFELAQSRRRRLCSVDKANVLETSRMWREVVSGMATRYPQVELRHMLVDTFAMQLIREPAAFDVVVTENLFGDILTDEASVLAGSLGMLPSASLGNGRVGLYEPIHGSAPDIAGKGIANPIGAILSAAMLLRHSAGNEEAAAAIERAVTDTLESGYRTADIAAGERAVSTAEMTRAVVDALKA
jgi:3-isopropylmalate dehydrogenase